MLEDLLVSRKEGLIEAEVDGEMVALHVDNGTCYGFNHTATAVWKLIEQPRRLGELCEALAGEFEVELGQCETEVLDLLRDLEADGLVELQGGAATAA